MPNEIRPAGEQYEVDDRTREAGIDKLKGKMGGDVPFWKSKNTPLQAQYHKSHDMAESAITSAGVPRRPSAKGDFQGPRVGDLSDFPMKRDIPQD